MRGRVIIWIVLAVCMVSCKKTTIQPKSTFPTEYSSVWEVRYGKCYDSIPYQVVALDIYSDGLSLDTAENRMTGTGYNLYISDIFVTNDTLAAGTYRSLSPSDMTPQPFTFTPGRDFEGTPDGIYLLRVENGKLQSIQVLDSGSFVMRQVSGDIKELQFTLYYSTSEKKKNTYECHYQGPFSWQKK